MSLDSVELQLLLVCGVGLGGALVGLLGLLFGPRRGWTAASFLLALLLLGVAAAEASLGVGREVWLALAAVGGLAGACAAIRCGWVSVAAGWLLWLVRRPRVQGFALLAASPAFVAWWLVQANSQLPVLEDTPTLGVEVDPSMLQQVDSVHAVTDRGQPVRLYTIAKGISADELKRFEQSTVQGQSLAQKQIRTVGPDPSYNCHGWVFADGHFWVRGADVPAVLEDNGYREVKEPRPGDVIVYRAADGAVLHTGLVRAAGDGPVLVESKWGWLGRYVHRPEDQAYGDRWAFYHSDRGDHRLQGLGGETTHVPLATSPASCD